VALPTIPLFPVPVVKRPIPSSDREAAPLPAYPRQDEHGPTNAIVLRSEGKTEAASETCGRPSDPWIFGVNNGTAAPVGHHHAGAEGYWLRYDR
jgi:hypothetical protein